MKKLYEYKVEYGRMGTVEGLFVADETIVMAAMGRIAHFGEILGKHSDISLELAIRDMVVKSEDQNFISKLIEIIGSNTISGYNPLDYMEEE